MPSVWDLFTYTYRLALHYVEYILFFGSWNEVLDDWEDFSGWWEDFADWVIEQAVHFSGLVQTALISAITTVGTSLSSAWDTIDAIILWINETALSAVNLVNTYALKLATWYTFYYGTAVDFLDNRTARIKSALGSAWTWLVGFYDDQYATLVAILGSAWTWLVDFKNNFVTRIVSALGSAWNWLVGFYNNQYATLAGVLGSVWTWLVNFYNSKYATLAAILGAAWDYGVQLWQLRAYGLVGFVIYALGYWYTVWADYRQFLSDFLADPLGWLVAALRTKFLEFLEEWIVDNW